MLTIKDLVANKEMTRSAMAVVFGGGHGIGNYFHIHRPSNWKLVNAHKHYLKIRRGNRYYKAVQYHWTWKRCQYAHRGKLRILGVC